MPHDDAVCKLCQPRPELASNDLGQQVDLPPAPTERTTYRFYD
jgi:hypothetical protein